MHQLVKIVARISAESVGILESAILVVVLVIIIVVLAASTEVVDETEKAGSSWYVDQNIVGTFLKELL